MSRLFGSDPLLGELRWAVTPDQGPMLTGSALLTPKHPVSVYLLVAHGWGERALARAAAGASKLFGRVRRSDWDYRLALADALLEEITRHITEDIPLVPESFARELTLTDINFLPDGSARLAYEERRVKGPSWHMQVVVNGTDSSFYLDLFPQG